MSNTEKANPDNINSSDLKDKATSNLAQMGKDIIFNALCLYFCMTDNNTPMPIKGTIAAALFYLLNPVDLIPDPIMFVGYTDDAGVLLAALNAVSSFVTDYHREKAHATMQDWGL